MTLEDIDRAIGEYEKALEHMVTTAKYDPLMLAIQSEQPTLAIAPGRIRAVIEDIEALNYMREKLASPDEGEQE